MKLFIASDIHGSAVWCAKMLDRYHKEQAGRMLLLGDILYHGPRNDLPDEYAPKEVIRMLNDLDREICSVRGNCEAEVDQMVLSFPALAEYCLLFSGNRTIFATHGHIFNETHLPPLKKQDVLLHGHTHIPAAEKRPDYYFLNPGSVALPKNGNPHTYAVLEDDRFTIRDMDGQEFASIRLED